MSEKCWRIKEQEGAISKRFEGGRIGELLEQGASFSVAPFQLEGEDVIRYKPRFNGAMASKRRQA
ncbi:MAG TPA: hypothetical protein VJR23_12460 [Candidatus Acidoferrales bacterium]|nr:hypothetical protein [Candidatus Acidoferrales bacterium]